MTIKKYGNVADFSLAAVLNIDAILHWSEMLPMKYQHWLNIDLFTLEIYSNNNTSLYIGNISNEMLLLYNY